MELTWEEYDSALSARNALIRRTRGRELTRDERRLLAHYDTKLRVDEGEARAIDAVREQIAAGDQPAEPDGGRRLARLRAIEDELSKPLELP